MGKREDDEAAGKLRHQLRVDLDGTSPYSRLRSRIFALTTAAREELADAMTAPFNAYIQALPHVTYDEKKELASWANEELRQLGLSIKCPKTGHSVLLQANPVGDGGRFRYQYSDAAGPHTTMSSATLPTLELQPIALSTTHRGSVRSDSGRRR